MTPDRDSLRAATLFLWEWLCGLDEPLKARALLANVPYLLEDDAELREARRRTEGMLSHLASSDAYAAHYFTQWEADTPASIPEIEASAAYYPRAHWALAILREAGSKTCLDVGSGNGYLCLFLACHGIKTMGLNLTQRAIAQCRDVAT